MSKRAGCMALLFLALLGAIGAPGVRAQMVTGKNMTDFDRSFGLDRNPAGKRYEATLTGSSIPGNILWPGDRVTFTIRVENRSGAAIDMAGKLECIPYGTKGKPGDVWVPTVYPIGSPGSIPVRVQAGPGGAAVLSVSPAIPARFGGYALVLDLGPELGRQFITSCVRTFRPNAARVQYPALSLDNLGPDVLQRLGVHAIRQELPYKATTDHDFDTWYAKQAREFAALQSAGVTVLAVIGGGDFTHPNQPLGRPRPWLDDKGVMQKTKSDLAWLPSSDPDFRRYVTKLASDFGWPKGPITAFALWNEPWEGISISGWGADMLRYRDMYTAMAAGVDDARRGAGVDVLVGGGDSSSNALDKLFGDGKDTFLPQFDFLSVHYQGMASFATYRPWRERKGPRGRVRIWDTESWVANTDDRVAAVVAANRAAGYDRAMGVYGGNVADFKVATAGVGNAWSVAAAVGATTHFLGERPFRELLFKNGLPWVMVFDGIGGRREDSTVVVVGDLGEEFGSDQVLFRTAREQGRPRSAATLSLSVSGNRFGLYDFYGNAVAPIKNNRIVVPLDGRGFFLRGDGKPGSFDTLIAALHHARIDGVGPLAIQAEDLTAPVGSHPSLRLRLTNVLNRPVTGTLRVELGSLTLAGNGQKRTIGPNETWVVALPIRSGAATESNTYPLRVTFAAGNDGTAVHREEMHANVIARRTITVDGDLNDWKDVLPQTIVAAGSGPTLTEAAWFPFQKFDAATGGGLATGYLAFDADCFYFAAKVSDVTPDGGTMRFANRNDDQFFYPETSYTAANEALTWPEGVRRYSYRKRPILPAGNAPNFDNVQIAFNVLPPERKRFAPNPPGTMPDFTIAPDSDYEYALNKVADQYGGGTEIWRLNTPGMPLKHFYPRQPPAPQDGPVTDGKLVVTQDTTTRIVEAAIPWREIPEVARAMRARTPIKFSFRVNDSAGIGCMELSRGRSVAKRGASFHVDWTEHWENQIEFGWEK